MKPLELTKEHKEKLLEMCIELFQGNKQYNHVEILRNNNIKFYKDYLNNGRGRSYSIRGTVSIHWFEFCINHLATVIYNKLDKPERGFTILYYRGMITQEAEHPVNYLYEEFKKLK